MSLPLHKLCSLVFSKLALYLFLQKRCFLCRPPQAVRKLAGSTLRPRTVAQSEHLCTSILPYRPSFSRFRLLMVMSQVYNLNSQDLEIESSTSMMCLWASSNRLLWMLTLAEDRCSEVDSKAVKDLVRKYLYRTPWPKVMLRIDRTKNIGGFFRQPYRYVQEKRVCCTYLYFLVPNDGGRAMKSFPLKTFSPQSLTRSFATTNQSNILKSLEREDQG